MTNPNSIYQYTPSTALAIVVAIIYLIPTLILGYQTLFKYRSWFFLCVWIGSAIEVAGYIVRAVSTKNVSDIVSTLSGPQSVFFPDPSLSPFSFVKSLV